MSEPIHSGDGFVDLGPSPASSLSPPQEAVESTTEHLSGSTPSTTVTDILPTTEAPSRVPVPVPADVSAATTATASMASPGSPSSTTGGGGSKPLEFGSSHHLRGREFVRGPGKLSKGPVLPPPPPPPPPPVSYETANLQENDRDRVPIYTLSKISTIRGFEELVTSTDTVVFIRSPTFTIFLPDIIEGPPKPYSFMPLITAPREGSCVPAVLHTVASPQSTTTTVYLDRARILFRSTEGLDRLDAEYCVIFSAVEKIPRGQISDGRQRRSFSTRAEAISEIARALYSRWDIKFVFASVGCDLEESQEHFRARMEEEAASHGWMPVWYQTEMSPVPRCLFY